MADMHRPWEWYWQTGMFYDYAQELGRWQTDENGDSCRYSWNSERGWYIQSYGRDWWRFIPQARLPVAPPTTRFGNALVVTDPPEHRA